MHYRDSIPIYKTYLLWKNDDYFSNIGLIFCIFSKFYSFLSISIFLNNMSIKSQYGFSPVPAANITIRWFL